MNSIPLQDHTKIPTLKTLIDACAEVYGSKPAFQFTRKKKDISVDFIQFKSDLEAFGTCLFKKGYQNCHIAVCGENSYEWILTFFATTCGRNVIVPIDKSLNIDQIAYFLKDSECKVLVYSHDYIDVAQAIQKLNMDIDCIDMQAIQDWIRQGKEWIERGYYDYLNIEVQKDDLASIVYTSGTTGHSKGVMLSHLNITASAAGARCYVQETGLVLLVLPLHHMFGLTGSVVAVMMNGNPIYINQSLKRLLQDIQTSQPKVIFIVPLFLEMLHKNIWNTAKKQGKEKALTTLIKLSDILLKLGIDFRHRFFKSVLSSLGGNLKLLVSGGAALDEKYVKVFRSFGITVLNGYGITECAPVVAVQRNDLTISGSVGFPLCCNQVRIADNGEILVKGDNVMQGYYHNEAETAQAFSNGWFKTGDLGHLDKYGALHITGRLKNLIILSNGENISAEYLEQQIYSISYVKEVIVYEQDDKIAAEIYLDPEVPDVQTRIHEDIRHLNQRLPLTQNIAKIHLRETEFPKTSTKKIKRTYGEH